MKKATNLLLMLTGILGFVCAGLFLILTIYYFSLAGASDQQIADLCAKNPGMLPAGMTIENFAAQFRASSLVLGIVFAIIDVASLLVAILGFCVKAKFKKGGEKEQFRFSAIMLIILGAISFELPIVPGVFLLAQSKENFKAE